MRRPLEDFGDTRLDDLERMTDEVAGFAARLPDRFRYSVMSAFRQTCAAGVRYGYMTRNPAKLSGKNPAPPPRSVRVFTPSELEALCAEFDTRGAAAITFAAATGLRPCGWAQRRAPGRRPHPARDPDGARHEDGSALRREVPVTAAALAKRSTRCVATPGLARTSSRGPRAGRSTFTTSDEAGVGAGESMPAGIDEARAPVRHVARRSSSNALARGLTVFELGADRWARRG